MLWKFGTLLRTNLLPKKTNDDGQKIIENDLSTNFESIVEQFDLYVAERKCVTGCRELFNNRNQKSGEPFSNWLTDLRNLIKDCEYGSVEDSMLKDRIIWGTHNKKVRESLRAKSNQSLNEIIDASKAVEATARYHRNSDETVEVDAAQAFPKKNMGNYYNQSQGGGKIKKEQNYHQNRQYGPYKKNAKGVAAGNGGDRPKVSNLKYLCKKCNKIHGAGNCPAWGKTCTKCNGRNHFSTVCKFKPQNSNQHHAKKSVDSLAQVTNQLNDVLFDGWDHSEVSEINMLCAVKEKNQVIVSGESMQPRKEYTEVLRLQWEHYVKFKLDPGSEVNSLPLQVFEMINKNYPVHQPKTLVKAYGNVISKPAGLVTFIVETKYGRKMKCDFLLSTVEPRPILGIEACEGLDLVKRVEHSIQNVMAITTPELTELPASKDSFLKKYEKLFTGLGEFKQTIKIIVDPKVVPGMCPPRRYHFSIISRLKTKLDSLEKTKIVAKVTTEIPKFVSNLVIREKSDGDLRICLDPEILNKAIVRQKYTIPTVEELSYKVKDKAIFTVLDLKDGFWHATLDEESSLLCSFATPFGIYKFLKMPFGLSCAPEIFQFLTEQSLEGTGAIVYFDDCLIAGKDYVEHDEILTKVMDSAEKANIRFNPRKIQYRQKEVKFLGELWSKNSTKVDPERVKAINAIKEPKTKTLLQKCLGTFNYLRKFIPQMATIAAPLYDLLSASVRFFWLPAHDQAFQRL